MFPEIETHVDLIKLLSPEGRSHGEFVSHSDLAFVFFFPRAHSNVSQAVTQTPDF